MNNENPKQYLKDSELGKHLLVLKPGVFRKLGKVLTTVNQSQSLGKSHEFYRFFDDLVSFIIGALNDWALPEGVPDYIHKLYDYAFKEFSYKSSSDSNEVISRGIDNAWRDSIAISYIRLLIVENKFEEAVNVAKKILGSVEDIHTDMSFFPDQVKPDGTKFELPSNFAKRRKYSYHEAVELLLPHLFSQNKIDVISELIIECQIDELDDRTQKLLIEIADSNKVFRELLVTKARAEFDDFELIYNEFLENAKRIIKEFIISNNLADNDINAFEIIEGVQSDLAFLEEFPYFMHYKEYRNMMRSLYKSIKSYTNLMPSLDGLSAEYCIALPKQDGNDTLGHHLVRRRRLEFLNKLVEL